MKTLSIDIETYSSADLFSCGVYRYAEAHDFTVLLVGYAFDGGDVHIADLTEAPMPDDLRQALTDPAVIKTAYNAQFERVCLAAYLGQPMPPEQWRCTMVKAAMAGLPMGLDAVAKALGLAQQKDSGGRALIRFFSLPCKPTKANCGRTRNHPQHDPFRWQEFKDYCRQDVRTEMAIIAALEWFQVPEQEQLLWELDQRINDRGVLLDLDMVHQAIRIDDAQRETLLREAVELSGLDNPASAAQLKSWLTEQTGEVHASLTKQTVPDIIAATDSDTVSRVLEIRQQLTKTSVKKYEAMQAAVCRDGRVRGLLQFYGATRTGRWAGRLVQVQNLPRNEMRHLGYARELVLDGDADMLRVCFGDVADTLSQLIRTAFVAPEGHTFAVADFSAIEARVIAWLAGEKWRMDVFNTHGKIYEASAAQMFKVPLEQVTKGSPLRQKGKVAELALGYQGGVNAMIAMGALRMGIAEDELPGIVAAWRKANLAIVRLWGKMEDAAIEAVDNPGYKYSVNGVSFIVKKDGNLRAVLPSGRELIYFQPRMKQGKFSQVIAYEGMNQMTKQWTLQDTYGGKLVENIVQAIARDCLAETLLRLDAAGFRTVMHIHDEVVVEVYQEGAHELAQISEIMSQRPTWAAELPLGADGYLTKYYKKD